MATDTKNKTKMKTCVSCETTYPAHSEFFATDVRKPDMCLDQCRFCTTTTKKEDGMATAPTSRPKRKKKRRSKRALGSSSRSHTKNRQQPAGAPNRKECAACLKEKTWKSFYADAKNSDKLMNRCIDCTLKKRKSRRPRVIGEHTRTLPNGTKIVINAGTATTRGASPKPVAAPKAKAKAKAKAPGLGIQPVTIDALLAEREAEIRADERQKVLAEIDSRYILVVKPE